MIDIAGPARGDDFCFRAGFLDSLWSCLKENNILLVAPRHMGKTSVMHRLLDFPRNNFLVIYLSAESLASPADFTIQLILALRKTQPRYFFQQLGMVAYEDILAEAPGTLEPGDALKAGMNWNDCWEDQAGHLIDGIRKIDQPVLFIIDELPKMFSRIQKQEQFEPFLRWFRSAREIPGSPVRWVVGGSTNLISALGQEGQWINDFYQLILPPFSLKEVEGFVLKAFNEQGVKFDARVITRMQELLGNAIPFFLQVMVRKLVDHWRLEGENPLSETVVDEIFDKELLGIRLLRYLQHFHSRIELRYPEVEREAVYSLLTQLSLENGVVLKELFSRYVKVESKRAKPRDKKQLMQSFGRLLVSLQIDFYVEDIGGRRYDFASQLLKVWWKKYHAGR